MQYYAESLWVRPDVGQINRFAQKAKQVAILAINPVYSHTDTPHQNRAIESLRIEVEGPQYALRYFKRLIDGAKLNIQPE